MPRSWFSSSVAARAQPPSPMPGGRALPVAAAALATLVATAPALAADPVPYPDGYRDWHHVKSMVIEKGHPLFDAFGGIHHLYANRKALEGYRKGRFPDGAVIVFDLLEAKSADSAVTEGPRKIVGVMHKDSKRWAATGGWGYEGFKGDTRERAVTDGGAGCHACHTQRKDAGFVFGSLRR